MLADGMSRILKTKYLKSLGNLGGQPAAAVTTCVMPLDHNENLLDAAIALPR